MHLKSVLAAMLAAVVACPGEAKPPVGKLPGYVRDVDAMCARVRRSYAYFAPRAPYWPEACANARDAASRATTRAEGLAALEALVDDLYDAHASLGANSGGSPWLVPSGSDMWLEWRGADAIVTGVRRGGAADRAGVSVGDRIVSIDGLGPREAALKRVHSGRAVMAPERMAWALNAAGAGYRNATREILIDRAGTRTTVRLGEPRPPKADAPLSWRMEGEVGVIRFNDSLGEDATVAAFDAALEALKGAKGWVLDLRDTPSGGATTIAEPILGRFAATRSDYQITLPIKGPPEPKQISPRGPWRASGPLVAIVGRWTGSMGEGMAVAVDGAHLGKVIGTRMAGLAGGVEGFDLPAEHLSVRFPAYRLSHVDGTPRELWAPPIAAPSDPGGLDDPALERALEMVHEH